ncbi:MAG TPA: 16S rRNA (guanine(527)-N(7))-methyltransferase RsmG [Nitrospirota bacterium]|nr:16S rRNA (guanine(527)-N(7))-methyltransferase RsmG [Nitrospirota bacterium]
MTPKELLTLGASELGFALSAEQTNSIFIYLTELKKWNQKINLTAIRDERDVLIKHVLDSLSFMMVLTPSPGLKLLDMGSGAGFPAIPIKLIQPDIEVTMVESVRKKASFLRHIIRTLKLTGIEVQDKRTQDIPDSFRNIYDVVTARAFADINMAIKSGQPFLKHGGTMVLSRGPEESIDVKKLAMYGIELEKRIDVTLPFSDYKRAIWLLKRI